jgi:hypothetical protein
LFCVVFLFMYLYWLRIWHVCCWTSTLMNTEHLLNYYYYYYCCFHYYLLPVVVTQGRSQSSEV